METLHVKKEESILEKGQRDYLVFPNALLVPGTIAEEEDTFDIILDTEGLTPFSEMMKSEGVNKYRLLIACGKLAGLRVDYSFSMNPDNLLYDINFVPKVKLRDGARGENDFLNEYKALIAAVCSRAYGFEDFYRGGGDLFRKDRFLQKIFDAFDQAEVEKLLAEEYTNILNRLEKNNIFVGKGKYLRLRLAWPILLVVVVALAGFIGKYAFFDYPKLQTHIRAADAFAVQDYVGVLHELQDVKLEDMTDMERFMAAFAGVKTSSLDERQQVALLQRTVSIHSDSLVLNYWAAIGRTNYGEAVGYAEQLNDIEMQGYALLMQKQSVEENTDLDGKKKMETLKDLDAKIKELAETVQEAETITTGAVEMPTDGVTPSAVQDADSVAAEGGGK